jgi:hypothetical protein
MATEPPEFRMRAYESSDFESSFWVVCGLVSGDHGRFLRPGGRRVLSRAFYWQTGRSIRSIFLLHGKPI